MNPVSPTKLTYVSKEASEIRIRYKETFVPVSIWFQEHQQTYEIKSNFTNKTWSKEKTKQFP